MFTKEKEPEERLKVQETWEDFSVRSVWAGCHCRGRQQRLELDGRGCTFCFCFLTGGGREGLRHGGMAGAFRGGNGRLEVGVLSDDLSSQEGRRQSLSSSDVVWV